MAENKAFASGETEAQFRKFWARLFRQSATPGIVQTGVFGSGLAVSQTSTASANVEVSSGLALTQDTVGAGVSPLVNDTVKTLDVLTANPMGATPRNDLVVFDAATSSVRVVVGTPNAVPVDPSAPSTAVALARLRHAASATTVPASKIDDLRSPTGLDGVRLEPVQAAGGTVTSVTTTEQTMATAPSVPGNGSRRFKVSVSVSAVSSSVANTRFSVRLYRGAVSIGSFWVTPPVTGASHAGPIVFITDVPSGAAVYTARFARETGTGLGAATVAEILVEHIGG